MVVEQNDKRRQYQRDYRERNKDRMKNYLKGYRAKKNRGKKSEGLNF